MLFIGNLPYNTTDAALQAHFKKLEPFILRHRTDPKTKKSKGFAFLEFEHYDKMKTCIKLYHHSILDPDDPTADVEVDGDSDVADEKKSKGGRKRRTAARKINVELTAGGGGKAEGRKEKIKTKNVRLEEQRKRRAESQRMEKLKKDKTAGEVNSKIPKETQERVAQYINGIHPSRLSRIDR